MADTISYGTVPDTDNTPLYASFANFPSATDFGIGIAQAGDTGSVYTSDGFRWSTIGLVVLVASTSTAAQNASSIQKALNAGGDIVVNGSGTILEGNPLLVV